MDAALAPSVKVLKALLMNPEELGDLYIPAKTWLESCGWNIRTVIVPFMGTLPIIERAQLGNWFEVHVAKNKDLCQHWLGLLPLAHTCMLWLVSLLCKNRSKLQKFDINDDNQVLEAAWWLQTTQSSMEEPDLCWQGVSGAAWGGDVWNKGAPGSKKSTQGRFFF